eukprot:674562-Prorocentrum_minimum.AAC.1
MRLTYPLGVGVDYWQENEAHLPPWRAGVGRQMRLPYPLGVAGEAAGEAAALDVVEAEGAV